MQLVQVRDLGQRPASNLSVIVQYIFGNKMPGEFIPGYPYQKGDTVYTVSPDGLTIKLWVCNISGKYPNVKEPYWTEFSINSFFEERLEKIIKMLYDPHPQMYSLSQTCGTTDISKMGKAIFELENTPPYMDVFYDGKLIAPDECEIQEGKICSLTISDESKLMIDFYTPSHNLARLIRRVTYIGEITVTALDGMFEGSVNKQYRVTLPLHLIDQYVSYGCEIYVNGIVINEGEYSIEVPEYNTPPYVRFYNTTEMDNLVGGITINPDTGDVVDSGAKCVINFMVSVSDNIQVIHNNYEFKVHKDMDSYDIDITNSGYINVFQTMSIFINKRRVPSNRFHFSKGFLNVKHLDDYLKKGDVLSVSVMSFIPNEYKYPDINHEDRRYITESIYTVENNTRLIPIPFMEFNEDLDDFIVFNENGALVSSAKYYIDNDYIRYYSHDQGVYIGDTLNFKMIDRNQNTIMRTFILTADKANQTEFTLPNEFKTHNYLFTMIFYSVGAYLSPKEYTINVGEDGVPAKLTITHDMTLDPDDRLEIIAFEYPSGVGSTSMECRRVLVMEEMVNKFKLDFQFDPAVTSFLIFANTGLFIGEKFYEISDDNILTIKGEEVYRGGWIDIIVVQSTGALTSADNILSLL